jgi:hypothetical protein
MTARARIAVLALMTSAVGCAVHVSRELAEQRMTRAAPTPSPTAAAYDHYLVLDEWVASASGAIRPDEHYVIASRPLELSEGGGAATSRVLAAPFPFHEALLSWNVDTPPGTGFICELRVRRSSDGFVSPWLCMGDWGAAQPLRAGSITGFDGGRVDVDAFQADRAFDQLEYRLRACGPGVVRVWRVGACLSAQRAPAPARPGSRVAHTVGRPVPVRLDVPFRSQRDERGELSSRICSPTSLAMVMQYRGVDVPTGLLAEACYDSTHDIYGNWPRNVQAAFRFGVPGYLRRFNDWADVERCIAGEQPLIISIRAPRAGMLHGAPFESTDGHLLVLTGFDERGDCCVNDPAASDAATGKRVYARDEIGQVWMHGSGGLAYVLLGRV